MAVALEGDVTDTGWSMLEEEVGNGKEVGEKRGASCLTVAQSRLRDAQPNRECAQIRTARRSTNFRSRKSYSQPGGP